MSYNPSNPNGQAAMADSAPVTIANNQSPVPVSGTFYQDTQPVSATSLPLPTGAATETTLAALNTKVTAVNTGAVVISSSALPSGASTLAEQQTQTTSLGTINTSVNTLLKPASTLAGVTTVGTVSSVTAIANALPTGTNSIGQVTANAGTNLNTSLLALDSTVAKDSSLSTLNTSVNTLLKPASTLAAVTTVGTVSSVTAIANALPAGDNNIGNVDIVTLPSIPAGTNNIGDVDVLSLPATPAGTNLIGFTSQAGQSGNTNALTEVDSTALAASLVIKNGAGRLYRLSGVNTGPAQYIQVFNATSAPANGTAPILLCYAPSFSNFSFDLGNFGKYFSTGITVTNSTTAATKTLGSADCWFNAGCL